jgi:hypothetical protein
VRHNLNLSPTEKSAINWTSAVGLGLARAMFIIAYVHETDGTL